jgi:beta-glucosidase
LTNTGTVAGSEIVQLYVAAPQDGIHRPVKELKRFDKITLEAGECKTVEFELRSDCYAIWHDNGWRVPAGEYRIMIASDSETVRLITVLSVEGDIIEPAPWQAGSWYETLSGDVTADEWSKLLGYRYHAPIVQKGRFDMSHSIGEMKDHSRLMKVADWGLKKYIGRGFTDKDDPVYHMMIASSVESTLSNLQITGGIPGGVIKRALQVANGEYMKRIKQLIK